MNPRQEKPSGIPHDLKIGLVFCAVAFATATLMTLAGILK